VSYTEAAMAPLTGLPGKPLTRERMPESIQNAK
jgi:hypothetical protein